jgi:hypothetical protein
MAKTRFFRIAVAGDTADGREISADWINQMAADYNPATYGARINMEHIRGYSPEGPFNAYGDVLALEARDVEIEIAGKKETRRALYAQIDPTDALVSINRQRQKVYTSCEVHPNFSKTGRAYLLGLAVTDNPASLGTEMLQFAAGAGDASPLKSRKTDPASLFTATGSHVLDVTPAEAPAADPAADPAKPSLLSQILGALGGHAPAVFAQPVTPPAPANDNPAKPADLASFTAAVTVLANHVDASERRTADAIQALSAKVDQMQSNLASEESTATERRPAATGAKAFAATDC